MESECLRKRANWLQAVARRMDSPRSARHLDRYAAVLMQIAEDCEMDRGLVRAR